MYRILGWQSFSFNSWKILCHFILASIISNDKSATILIDYSLYARCSFTLTPVDIFFFVFVFKNLIMMSLHDFLLVYPSGVYSAFWIWKFMSFDKFGKFWFIISMCNFFSPVIFLLLFLNSSDKNMRSFIIVPHISKMLLIFFQSVLFFLLWLNNL